MWGMWVFFSMCTWNAYKEWAHMHPLQQAGSHRRAVTAQPRGPSPTRPPYWGGLGSAACVVICWAGCKLAPRDAFRETPAAPRLPPNPGDVAEKLWRGECSGEREDVSAAVASPPGLASPAAAAAAAAGVVVQGQKISRRKGHAGAHTCIHHCKKTCNRQQNGLPAQFIHGKLPVAVQGS